MKIITLLYVVIALASLSASAERMDSVGFFRDPGLISLDEKGTRLKIVESANGLFSWELRWAQEGAPVTIGKADYFKIKGWFVFVESPTRVWLFDGLNELMLVEETKTEIIQTSAINKNVFQSCPSVVVDALPDKLRNELKK